MRWLLDNGGRRLAPTPELFGHDMELQGWSWSEGCHSWVEPTAYAVTALRAAGEADHPRVREAVRLLLDRALPEGGWNYGNTRVLQSILRPFPATTGIALTALAGEPEDRRIDRSVNYLTEELRRIRSPFSLAWGVIGLSAWDARPPSAERWLAESAQVIQQNGQDSLTSALLALAETDWRPSAHHTLAKAHG